MAGDAKSTPVTCSSTPGNVFINAVDWPVVKVAEFAGVNPLTPPPLFRYCGNNETLHIVFPDWSYWGWTFIDLEADTDTNTCHEVASHQPRHLYPYNPPDSAAPWNHMHSSWKNPSFGFPQRVASEQRYPVNAQKQGGLGDRLQFESIARYNSWCGNKNHNMFYNEFSSSSSPKSKFYGTGYTYPNGGRSDFRPGKPSLESNGKDVKFVRDLNLNVTLFSNTPVVEVRKDEEERLATLPWLVKPKSACNSEVADGRPNQKISDAVQREAETEKINTNLNIPRDECNAERDKVRMMLDINEPCEPLSDADEQLEEQIGTKVSVSNKCHIDLNMSVSEEEEDEIDLSPHLLDIDIARQQCLE
ncbi:unnamed protein product [Eruca vesicaria subsp. sativa]|uniref:Glycosyl transferase CAP10 domain-containing protein n=1 Tax=Eruca vesicaria subsp. sativa TaxID=29727 RepID=A0ABC8LNI6_ERUVS|nr:unnamed protein product [Eruca vesicaria subsp. sativa]